MVKMGRPPADNPKTKRITARVTSDEHSKLEKLAQKKGLTLTELVRQTMMNLIK